MGFLGAFTGGGVGPAGAAGPQGAAGAVGATGNPGAWVLALPFTQPAVLGAANTRWLSLYLTPEVGMVLAGAAGVYQVTANLGSGIYELTCLEIRGVAQGGTVVANSVFGQAAPS